MSGGAAPPLDSLWRDLLGELERLTANRPRGVNFSEDFAVDRACAALSKLERNYASKGEAPARQEVAREAQHSAARQAKLDEALVAVAKARATRDELAKELEEEERGRRASSEDQVMQWRDAALKTHACSASLRAKEQERLQLEQALHSPSTNFDEVWHSIVHKLQAELDVARTEAAKARRELQHLTGAAPSAAPTPAAAAPQSPGPRVGAVTLVSSARSSGAGDARAAPTARVADALGGQFRATSAEGLRGTSRDDVLRASRAADVSRCMQAGPTNTGFSRTRPGGPLPTTTHRGMEQQGVSAIRSQSQEMRPFQQNGRPAAPAVAPRATILHEAQKILAKVEALNGRRSAG